MRPIAWLARVLLPLAQAVLAGRVLIRLARSVGGRSIEPVAVAPAPGRLSVLLPVLNEQPRIAACLEGLMHQGAEVAEILVVDGGSVDRTVEIVGAYAAQDSRIRLIDAAPVPPCWNGKPWGLEVGRLNVALGSDWLLTIDADVHAQAGLVASLLAEAERNGLEAFSVATEQEIGSAGDAIVHPALLTTLVYRFGIPGHASDRVARVQANGQCFLLSRALLDRVGGFETVRDSICEDVTLARAIAARGDPVGFFEAPGLVSTGMYRDWRETVTNWPRSLPMRDRYFGAAGLLGLLEVLLVQALPLPLLVGLGLTGRAGGRSVRLNQLLALIRAGVLVGTARAYPVRPWSYWLSPLFDLPAALLLIASATRRRHVWRGRPLLPGGR